MLKGWRTILVNVGLTAGAAALQGLAGVDWVSMLGPVWSMAAVAGINIAMRVITSSPVGVK